MNRHDPANLRLVCFSAESKLYEYFLISTPGIGMLNGLCFAGVILYFIFLTVTLETNLRMYWTDLHQIFTIGVHVGGYDQSDLLFAIAQGALLW